MFSFWAKLVGNRWGKQAGLPLAEAEFVAFDTELTGLDPRRDAIVSLGAVRMRGSRIYPGQTFYRLVRAESELGRKSVLIHEITPADLEGAAEIGQVLAEFREFVGEAVLVGHFVHIDVEFVNRAMKKKLGQTMTNPTVDTAALHDWLYENDSAFARHVKGMSSKTDLFSLAQHYGIEVNKAHNALQDAWLAAQLLQRFYPFLAGCGIKTVKELLAVARH